MSFASLLWSVVFLAVASVADGQILKQRKPGLWELQYTIEGAEAQAEQERVAQRLRSMSPERRAQMEAAMMRRGMGVTLGPDGRPMTTMRFCLTSEDISQESQGLLKGAVQDGDCDRKVISQSAHEVHIRAACRSPEGTSEVDAKIYDVTPERYAVDMRAKRVRGDMHMQQKARWLSGDCKGAAF